MKLYVHGFWPGFITNTDPITVEFFLELLTSVYNEKITLSGNKDECDILLESIFSGTTCLFDKKWKNTFLFSGESHLNKWSNFYDCILSGFKNTDKTVQLPLFSVLYKNMTLNKVTEVPKKGICAVISNPNGTERNDIIEKINERFPIDFGGKYKNNVEIIQGNYNSEELQNFIRQYKFVIAMENTKKEGYITEKILHGARNGTIPIYWGTQDVNLFFNSERIINADDPDFLDKIEKLMEDSALYMETINKPVFKKEFDYDNMIQGVRTCIKICHKIGFLSNHLTLRGCEVALYDYADYNEKILGNKSIVITRKYEDVNAHEKSTEAYNRFSNRFQVEYYKTREDIDNIVLKFGLTHLYIIKSGEMDGLFTTVPTCRNLIHCVFNSKHRHGDVYAVVSDSVNTLCETTYDVVPHMVTVEDTSENLRDELGIKEGNIVFGSYGGKQSFNIQFVKKAIQNVLTTKPDLYFLFMNTPPFISHDRVIFVDGTSDRLRKRKFINTCDAMIHARTQGETFGLACGEFSLCGKPIITYGKSKETEHLKILGDKAIIYSNQQEIENILSSFTPSIVTAYTEYSPENVMKIFEKVFLCKDRKPSVLLNMIVKNETHVIEKTLTNLCDKIPFTTYVISDTGSTDDTKAKIKAFFDKKGIQGEIYDDEWRDFGYNRTKALEHAYNKSDLLFVFDADDELHGDFSIPNKADYDSYHLHFGNGYGLNYWRVCLVNNRKKWEYVGVLHEYIHLVDGQGDMKNVYLQGNYHVQHGVSGGRSKDPDKYSKDAAILEKAFNELPENNDLRNRYAFYCANSYKDSQNIEKAIEWYKRVIGLNGWVQERYRSCIMLHNLYRAKGELEKALFWCVKSVKFDQTRVEGICKLVQHYCAEDMNAVAYSYYILIQNWYENVYINDSALSDKLFVDILEYDFFLPYYMIIVSDKIGKREIGVKMYDMIFTKGKVAGQWWIDNLTYNFQFFYKLVGKDKAFGEKAKKYLKVMEDGGLTPKESFYHNVFEIMN